MQTPEVQKGGSVPLDWVQVKRRYGDGAEIPTVAGGKTVHIVGVRAPTRAPRKSSGTHGGGADLA
jgi:hypothetical protein